jgi:hypothetical protein
VDAGAKAKQKSMVGEHRYQSMLQEEFSIETVAYGVSILNQDNKAFGSESQD